MPPRLAPLLLLIIPPLAPAGDGDGNGDGAGPPPASGAYRVVSPKDEGVIISGINARGDLVGFAWADDADNPGVMLQVPFFSRGEARTTMPTLEGYTATFPADVSDDGLVVGRVSKPAPLNARVFLRNQAFIWDAQGGIRGLGALADDWASFATGVSADGRRIAGYSIGDNRVRACAWDRNDDGRWEGTPLPHAVRLGSNVVAISDDGRRIAAVDGTIPSLWTRGDDGSWSREAIGEPASLVPRGVNNDGMVVGLRYTDDGLTHAVIWTRDGGCKPLPEPEGFVKSEAAAVNNRGAVVGTIDGPGGSEIGPCAFLYENGRLRIIDEAGPGFTAATVINDRGDVAGILEEEEEGAEAPAPAPADKQD